MTASRPCLTLAASFAPLHAPFPETPPVHHAFHRGNTLTLLRHLIFEYHSSHRIRTAVYTLEAMSIGDAAQRRRVTRASNNACLPLFWR